MREEAGREKAIVFIDDAHTFGGAQVALGWAIHVVLRRCESQAVVCVCTPATREAIRRITGEHRNLRFFDCPAALPLNIFAFPFRMWTFRKLLRPWTNKEGQLWCLNLAGIEFCLAPLLILRLRGLRPMGWLHNQESLLFLNAHNSLLRRVLCRLRDAIANKMIFGQYRLLVTSSRTAEASLKERFGCDNLPRSGFLHPYSGIEEEVQKSDIARTWSGPIDLWMIGRVEYGHKNNRAGLEVLRYLKERNKDASLTIVGDGPDMEKFRSDTKALGLSQVVHLRDWESNPWESVPRSAIVFIPSRFESFCLVALEAMLRGIRVVLSPLPVFFEWIPSDLIARDFTTEAFAEKVEELSAMSRERALALYATVLDQNTEKAFATRFMSILLDGSGEALRDATRSSAQGEA